MAQRARGQPIVVLSEDSERTQGRDAQTSNIAAAKAIAESVRTTLGPKGMDKMLVDSSGEVVITNDGVTILKEMDIEHPAAQMLIEVAESQEDEVGDGTTTATVLAGQLLAQSEDLIEQDVHPRTIIEGYAAARQVAQDAIDDLVLDEEVDDDLLQTVTRSSMTGKGTGDVDAGTLADLIVQAVRQVEHDGEVNRNDINVVTQTGQSSGATELIQGIVFDEEPAHDEMPRSVEDATVAVLNAGIDLKETSIDAELNVTDSSQMAAAVENEERILRELVEKLDDAGVDVVFAQDDIEDRAAAYLAQRGILAFEDLGGYSDDTPEKVRRATGAATVNIDADIDEEDLGYAASVSVERYGDDDLVFVEGDDETESVTLFVRGSTQHVSDELERATKDALDVAVTALTAGGVVPGAGATEVAVAEAVRDAAAGIEGRKQLAVEAFADAVETLPRTLAENTGMDQIDALVDLRAEHDANPGRAGIVAVGETGEIGDPIEHGVLDPAAVKREAVDSATEASTMIVRIDDVISAN